MRASNDALDECDALLCALDADVRELSLRARDREHARVLEVRLYTLATEEATAPLRSTPPVLLFCLFCLFGLCGDERRAVRTEMHFTCVGVERTRVGGIECVVVGLTRRRASFGGCCFGCVGAAVGGESL